jgi:hypothetical protein
MTEALPGVLGQLGLREFTVPSVLVSGWVSNATPSRIPRGVEANRHYDLIKQRDIFSNHQTVTSFLRKKFVQKNCTNTDGDQPTPKNRRLQLQIRKIIRTGNSYAHTPIASARKSLESKPPIVVMGKGDTATLA